MLTKSLIESYFNAEKNESLLFMIMGVMAVLAAIYFFFLDKSSFAKGMAIPLLLVGATHFVVGFTVYKKSDGQRIDIVYALDMNPNKIRREEMPRMAGVMQQFKVLRYTEIALFLIGSLLYVVFQKNEAQVFWYGFGLALSIEALLSLILDFFAEKRGNEYFEAIKHFIQ